MKALLTVSTALLASTLLLSSCEDSARPYECPKKVAIYAHGKTFNVNAKEIHTSLVNNKLTVDLIVGEDNTEVIPPADALIIVFPPVPAKAPEAPAN